MRGKRITQYYARTGRAVHANRISFAFPCVPLRVSVPPAGLKTCFMLLGRARYGSGKTSDAWDVRDTCAAAGR